MNSNHLTLYSIYEEETKWSVTQGKYNHIKKEAQTVISTTHESLTKTFMHSLCYSKNIYVIQNYSPLDGFQPPSLKKDAYLYIK